MNRGSFLPCIVGSVLTSLAFLCAPSSQSEHLGSGIPKRDETMIVREGYVAMWSDTTRTPAWVQYRLKPEYVAKSSAARPPFTANGDVKRSATNMDYTNTGWDRGHLFPYSDASRSRAVQVESMELTNVVPQAPRLNRGGWMRLEAAIRNVAKESEDTYVITVTAGYARSVGSGVSVPDRLAKIVAAKRDGKWRVCSLVCDNADDSEIRITSLAEVERQSGWEFLDKIVYEPVDSLEKLCVE